MTDDTPAPRRPRIASIVILAVLGAASVWWLAQPAPATHGAARLRSPEILLAVFDTVWLLVLALPREPSWAATVTKLVVGAPFHLAIASAYGAGPGFHAAWTLVLCAFAAVGTVGARVSPRCHGIAMAVVSFALPLAAYAAGDLGGAAARPFLSASPLVAPTILARTSRTASAADAVPALIAAAIVFAVVHVVSRRRTAPAGDA
jgi:hypothetical protein